MAAAFEPERLTARRPVERLGDRCPPVDHHNILLAVRDAKASDVIPVIVGVVDASEDERAGAEFEMGQPTGDGFVEDVTLEPGLVRTAGAGLGEVGKAAGRLARRFKTLVGVIDIRLLCLQLWMTGHS